MGSCYEPESASPLLGIGRVHAVVYPLAVPSNILKEPETDPNHRPT